MADQRAPSAEVAIEDLGLVGDTRTAALMGPAGTVEWMCLPRFDSEPVFGSLVGGPRAGMFTVAPADPAWRLTDRRYRDGSAVLETTWSVGSSEVVLTEGMLPELGRRLLPASLLVRRVEVRGDPVEMAVCYSPRRLIGGRNRLTRNGSGMLVSSWGRLAIGLTTSSDAEIRPDETVMVTVAPEKPLVLALSVADGEPIVRVDPAQASDLLEEADRWWRDWSRGVGDGNPFQHHMARSAITLRLLTYAPSGAPVAAPTTSLPEELGGTRNWDYRFAWARDASIGMSALLNHGRTDEASAFLYWMLHAGRLSRPNLAAMFTLDGTTVDDETVVEGWPGYRNSPPVRVGNSAGGQHQLDAYGWVIDAVWNYTRAGGKVFREVWRMVSGLADTVAARWDEPDAGIWEVRGDERHYVHSKLMAWLALDRAVRMADERRTRSSRVERWRQERDRLAKDLRDKGVDKDRNRYRRSYGADDLDAAVLLLPVVGFEPIDAPIVGNTIDAIAKELGAGGPLLYRYPPRR